MSKALVIITNGEARGINRNESLLDLASSLRAHRKLEGCNISTVLCGVLSGQPSVAHAFQQARKHGAQQLLVYPLFMSEGYFFNVMLPKQISEANTTQLPVSVLPPLGSDPALPSLLYKKCLDTLARTGWHISRTRLLLVGHGSTKNPSSANATRNIATRVQAISEFEMAEPAFLEEEPFFEGLLEKTPAQATVIAGYFTGSGLHGRNDIAQAIQKTGAKAIYSGSVGAAIEVRELILAAVGKHSLQ